MNNRDLVLLLSNGIPLFEHVIIDFLTSNINRTARQTTQMNLMEKQKEIKSFELDAFKTITYN